MNLNIDEITNLLNTWNSWYLLEHDSYLASEWSGKRPGDNNRKILTLICLTTRKTTW